MRDSREMKEASKRFFWGMGLLLVALREGSATGQDLWPYLACCVQQCSPVCLCSGTLNTLLVLPEREEKKKSNPKLPAQGDELGSK